MKITIVLASLLFLSACGTMTTNTAQLGERTAALEARVDLLEQEAARKRQ